MAKRKRSQYYSNESTPASAYNFKPEWYSDMDPHQRTYAKSLRTSPVTFCDAKSGTGKTTIATMVGLEGVQSGEFQKIIYVRFVDDRFLQDGFLPGDADANGKYKGLFQPFFDALVELGISESTFNYMFQSGQIELTTDRTLRGTNLRNAFIIGDECQNARQISDLLLLLTRIHSDTCRVSIIGHSAQLDNKKHYISPKRKFNVFQAFAYHFSKKPWSTQCTLVKDYRGPISQWADEIWGSLEEI